MSSWLSIWSSTVEKITLSMFYISSFQALNQVFIVVIFSFNKVTSACFADKIVGRRAEAVVKAFSRSVEINIWVRIVIVFLIVPNKIAIAFMDFLLIKLFRFYFWVLAFKAIKLEYPRAIPNTPNFILGIGLSFKLKSILLCNLAALNISTVFAFLFFTCLFKSF